MYKVVNTFQSLRAERKIMTNKNYFTKTLKEFRETNLILWDVCIADAVESYCWWDDDNEDNNMGKELKENQDFFEDICSFISITTLKLDGDIDEYKVLQALDGAMENGDITLEELKTIYENDEIYQKAKDAIIANL